MCLSSRSWHLRKVCKLFDHGCHCLKCQNLLSYCHASLEVFVVPPELQIRSVEFDEFSLSLSVSPQLNSLRNLRWACCKETFSYIQQHRDSTLGILGIGGSQGATVAPEAPFRVFGGVHRPDHASDLAAPVEPKQMAERYANLRITSQTDAPLYQ